MSVFHTNGRIVSSSGTVPSAQSSSSESPITNQIYIVYASDIVVAPGEDIKNKDSAPQTAAGMIKHIAQAQTLQTVNFLGNQQNPQGVVFAAALQGNMAAQNELPCNDKNLKGVHPDNTCYICYYGSWRHIDEVTPTPCGKNVWDGVKCTFIEYPLPPCYGCDALFGEGLYFLCDNCEDCNISTNSCDNLCPDGLTCTKKGCYKKCSGNADCDWLQCLECKSVDVGDQSMDICSSKCSSGQTCVLGICIDQCSPACDASKCETCLNLNVNSDGEPDYVCGKTYGILEECCNGNVVPKSNECFTYDSNCQQVNTCPPGTACNGRRCVPSCNDASDCAPCQECGPIQPGGANFCYNRCTNTQVCENGVCVEAEDVLECSRCDRPVFDRTKCSNTNRLNYLDINCYSCKDLCAELAEAEGRNIVCSPDGNNGWFCRYEPGTTIASYNFIP